MADLKHVGRLTKNKQKVIVVFRVLPGDPNSALVLPTERLTQSEHDTLMKVVESNAAQTTSEISEVMNRSSLPETGDSMLVSFHKRGLLQKVATNEVELMPNAHTSALLSDVNEAVAQQKGISVADLAVQAPTPKREVEVEEVTVADRPTDIPQNSASTGTDAPLSDDDLARQYRSQADAMFKEAKRLREQAEELSPTKKKAKVVKETT